MLFSMLYETSLILLSKTYQFHPLNTSVLFYSLEYLEKELYTNVPTAHYYLQFNTSSRWLKNAQIICCKVGKSI